MKVLLALTFLATLALSLALPQVGHGSVNGPSGVSIPRRSQDVLLILCIFIYVHSALPYDEELGATSG